LSGVLKIGPLIETITILSHKFIDRTTGFNIYIFFWSLLCLQACCDGAMGVRDLHRLVVVLNKDQNF
jgi:hypothetical protein